MEVLAVGSSEIILDRRDLYKLQCCGPIYSIIIAIAYGSNMPEMVLAMIPACRLRIFRQATVTVAREDVDGVHGSLACFCFVYLSL